MPELRSSETDTEIWLSSDLKDTVLIHSDMLKTSSWFRASLSEAWTSSMTDNLSTSKQKNGVLYSYGLKADIDDHAYSLHRGQFPDQRPLSAKQEYETKKFRQDNPVDFYRSTASPYWDIIPAHAGSKSQMFLEDYHKHAIRDHKVMFALLLGLDIELRVKNWMELATCLANVTAYIQYYDLLPQLARPIRQLFYSLPEIWEDVASSCDFYLALGDILRAEAIFEDALRHYISSDDHRKCRLESYSFEIQFLVRQKALEVASFNQHIEDDIRKLTFHHFYWNFLDSRNGVYKSEPDKARFLARAIFAEYLNVQFTTKRGPFNLVTQKVFQSILTHAKDDLSARLFRIKTPQQMAYLFHLGKGSEKDIEEELQRLLKGAADRIIYYTEDDKAAPRAARYNIQFTTTRYHQHKVFEIYSNILHYAEWDLSSRLFRTQTPKQLSALFRLKKDYKTGCSPQKLIKEELKCLLNTAAETIKGFTEGNTAPLAARFAAVQYYTNLTIEKEEYSWAYETPWDVGEEEKGVKVKDGQNLNGKDWGRLGDKAFCKRAVL
ncbi:hypothetical protein MMC06_000401 [Schaereria dolodes]|nr:hypothetical protein [Schaereria dolodes]